MRLSVLVPAYNDLAGVLACLNSLQATARVDGTFYFVQDDASPAVDFRAVIPPMVAATVRNPANLGFGGNCNAAAARADGDVLFFVNQDVSAGLGISDGWDAALLAAFDDPAVGIVAPLLLFPDGRVQSCGGAFDALGQPIHRCLGWKDLRHPQIADPCDLDWATGAALAFRRACWEQIGGFDTRYGRGYFEDVAACLAARAHGWRIRYVPAIRLAHPVGSTGGNPDFLKNALLWKRDWLDSGKVKPGLAAPTFRWW